MHMRRRRNFVAEDAGVERYIQLQEDFGAEQRDPEVSIAEPVAMWWNRKCETPKDMELVSMCSPAATPQFSSRRLVRAGGDIN
jgi:hypothetical protein